MEISQTPLSAMVISPCSLVPKISVLNSRTCCALGANIRNATCRSCATSGELTAGACAGKRDAAATRASRPKVSAWCCMQHRVYNDSLMRETISLCALLVTSAPFVLSQSHCADMLEIQARRDAVYITRADATPASAPGTLRISPTFPGTVGAAVPSF